MQHLYRLLILLSFLVCLPGTLFTQRSINILDRTLPLSLSAQLPDSTTFYTYGGVQGFGDRSIMGGVCSADSFALEAGYRTMERKCSLDYYGFAFSMDAVLKKTHSSYVSLHTSVTNLNSPRKDETSEAESQPVTPDNNITFIDAMVAGSHPVSHKFSLHAAAGYTYYERLAQKSNLHLTAAASYAPTENVRCSVEYQNYFPSFEYLTPVMAATVSWKPDFFYMEAGYVRYFTRWFDTPDGYTIRSGVVF